MGMPCEVNSIVKLDPKQFPAVLELACIHQAVKTGYRIYPMEVPLQLVDENWLAHGEVVITKLVWENQQTFLEFKVVKVYQTALNLR